MGFIALVIISCGISVVFNLFEEWDILIYGSSLQVSHVEEMKILQSWTIWQRSEKY